MPKEVIVLGLEGTALRGLRLVESGKQYAIAATETWDWAPVQVAAGVDAPLPKEAAHDGEEDAAGDAGDPLADAFAAAVKTFAAHEFVLSLPLSKLLTDVIRVPIDKRDTLEDVARELFSKNSPFPDEVYRIGTEIVSETDREVIAIVSALPEAVSLEIGDALEAAKARITRTDITALGRLRTLWSHILMPGKMARRVVLMDLDDGWDCVILDDNDVPVVIRGLGYIATAAELGREVMLGLIRAESTAGARDVGEVVVLTAKPSIAEDIRTRLAAFAPVRLVSISADDAYAGVEGVANRTVEEAGCDVTPEAWVTALTEARLKTRVLRGLAVAGGVWALAMGVLFGVPFYFNWMTGREKAACKAHYKAYHAVKDMKDRVKLVQRYSDHARGALETLKAFSDRLPEGVTLTQFQYRRGDSVRVSAEAEQPTEAYAFKKALAKASDEEGVKIYSDVTLSEVRQSRGGGNRFDVEAKFPVDEEEAAGTSATSKKGGR